MRRSTTAFLSAAGMLFFCWMGATAGQTALPGGVTRGPAVEGIAEYRLKNGLRVLLYPDPSKAKITVNITYLVGSRHESYGETGMAHLLEHLLFKGSRKFPDASREFSRRGFSNNASTSLDRTNYYSTFAPSDDNLRWALGWSADAMVNAFIAKKDLDSEMTVVRNEFELGENSPMQTLGSRMFSVMYDWHNYGNSTIGNRSDIENVRIDNLRRFYRTYYQPDNAVLVVAGKFDAERTLRWIAELFGPIPRPARLLPALWTVEPVQEGERSVTVRRKGDTQVVMVGYRIPAALHPDTLAVSVASDILCDGAGSRLHRELVETGLATSVACSGMLGHDPGATLFAAVVKQGDSVDAARDRLIAVVEGTFAESPATDAELTRIRRDSQTQFQRMMAEPEELAVGLSEFIALGDWRLLFVLRDGEAAVGADAVTRGAGNYFQRDNRTIATFVPENTPRRAVMSVAPSVAERLEGFKPGAQAARGEAFDATPANLDARTKRIAIGDLKLALLPKKSAGEAVQVALAFRHGDAASLDGRSFVGSLVAQMAARGTSRYTRQEIADEMTRLQMTGAPTRFETTRANLADALRLAAHVRREASFPPAEFAQFRRESLARLQALVNEPAARASDALEVHFNTYPAGDARGYRSLAESLAEWEKVTLDDVRTFHADFWGSARGEISIVGDFDAQAIEALVRELFPGWQSKAPYARLLREFRAVMPVRVIVDTPGKESAQLLARINLDMRDDDADYPALMLADYMFGGGSGLSNRLIERVRQRDGLSYSADSSLDVPVHHRAASWNISATTAPQNAQRLEAALRDELARMLKNGFTAKEVADAKNGMLQERILNRSQDSIVVFVWQRYLDEGRSFAYSQLLDDRLRALTPAAVLAAVRRHVDPAKLTVVIAGDTAKGLK